MNPSLSESLRLGQRPCVVGTIITADYLRQCAEDSAPLPCDLVELRADGFPDLPGWIEAGAKIQAHATPTPVFATIRLAAEGGLWKRPDEERWPLLQPAIHELSGVDVEIVSPLALRTAALCRELGKLCILSHHDFEKTPPPEELRWVLRQAHDLGAVGKIAARVNTPEDLENLRALLREPWPAPICVIGMGPLGRETRLAFPREGSCFTYGYLDTPGAPGQYSAAQLAKHFARSQ